MQELYELVKALPELLDFVVMLTQSCMAVVLARMLPMRHPALFVLVEVVANLPVVYLRDAFPLARLLFVFEMNFVLPWLFWRASNSQKAIAALLGMVVMSVSEVSGALTWTTLSGGMPLSNEVAVLWPAQYGAAVLVWLLVMLLLGEFVARVFGGLIQTAFGGGMRLWFVIPLTQLVLLGAPMSWGQFALDNTSGYYVMPVLLLLLCLSVDLLMLCTACRAREARLAERGSALLQQRLDDYLAECDRLLADVTEVARLRHDLRNHLQVTSALIDRGDMASAERYAHGVRVGLAAPGGESGQGTSAAGAARDATRPRPQNGAGGAAREVGEAR